jgi:NADP-dependent 3-hydroxy acid dehydrogenase YdfG
VSIRNQWDDTIAQTIKNFGRVDILINNGGVVFGARFTGIFFEKYNALLNTNGGLHTY